MIKDQLNKEIQRRGSYRWWDPLVVPRVGEDRTPPLTLPDEGERMVISDKTYTINTPSEGALERTRNIHHEAHKDSPGGGTAKYNNSIPSTSAARFDIDEIKNFLVGLAKIQDINLFYGRDEQTRLAYRDPQGIEDVLIAAQESKLNELLQESNSTKIDPLTGEDITYPIEDDMYVMPSGEADGEETDASGPSANNFYDDHGSTIIDSGEKTIDGQPIMINDPSYTPVNLYVSPKVDRSWNSKERDPNTDDVKIEEGGVSSSRFGFGPRNPQQGNSYRSRPVYGGVAGACNTSCTGLCFRTCDNECSESCFSTCWNRCGEACSSTCGNICTGCNSMCYTSCKTKCENSVGYSCLHVGAQAVKITSVGKSIGDSGEPGSDTWPRNTISVKTYQCHGCAYTCQFYPNKRTTCWDTACQATCFTSCRTACSTTCFGGCIDNPEEKSSGKGNSYKTAGRGRGCSSGCTVNCVGACRGICEGYCIQTCFQACKATCYDNCSWKCHTDCGSGCAKGCTRGCTGCSSCTGTCEQNVSGTARCIGCGASGGCTSTCQHDCNKNCLGWGCRSICGIESSGACGANCRLSCMSASCTSLCSDACSARCTSCAFNCGFNCGCCSSECSTGCSADCNITCTERCQHDCDHHCYMNCTDVCGGCSNLCYSCVGKCIGLCSVKCENGCSLCTNNCTHWCDTSCNRECFNNCSDRCINTCSGYCTTYLQSSTKAPLPGPERPPTADGYIYPNPIDRKQERHSFRFKNVPPPARPEPEIPKEYLVRIFIDEENNIQVVGPEDVKWLIKSTSVIGGVWVWNNEESKIGIIPEALESIMDPLHKPEEGGNQLFIILIYDHPGFDLNDIYVKFPWEFKYYGPIRDHKNNIIVILEKETWDNLI